MSRETSEEIYNLANAVTFRQGSKDGDEAHIVRHNFDAISGMIDLKESMEEIDAQRESIR